MDENEPAVPKDLKTEEVKETSDCSPETGISDDPSEGVTKPDENAATSVKAALEDLHRTLDEGEYPFSEEVGEEITDPVVIKHMKEIEAALASEPVNLSELRRLATWGFVNNEMRKKVWPHLLGVDSKKTSGFQPPPPKEHEWTDLVDKDVARSMGHFDVDRKLSSSQREKGRQGLKVMINSIFSDPANQELHYIQGYHDICLVFFRICGPDLGHILLEHLSKRHIRDNLRSDLTVIIHILSLLFPLIEIEDPEVFAFLSKSQVQPHFAVSWVLTWFAHNLDGFREISLLYDFFLANHPLMPLYYSAVIILSVRKDLLSTPCDYAQVFKFFQQFPHGKLNLQESINKTLALARKQPPGKLAMEHRHAFPKDSPMLAWDVSELANLKIDYSHPLRAFFYKAIFDPTKTDFWIYFGIPIGLAAVSFYIYGKPSVSR